MEHYAGLDVSVKETSVCIVDETGAICRELKILSYPDDLIRVLKDPAWRLVRVGLEAGPLSQWLFSGLAPPDWLSTGLSPSAAPTAFEFEKRAGTRKSPRRPRLAVRRSYDAPSSTLRQGGLRQAVRSQDADHDGGTAQ
jgi:hypothetical protein